MKRRHALALAALLSLSLPACAQRIALPAEPVLAGEPFPFQLLELQPGQEVSLSAERVVRMFSGQVARFRSEARFRADASGRVDLGTQAPLPGGSYEGADLRGLLWSMAPQPGAVAGQPVFNRVQLRLADAAGQPLAAAELALRQSLPTVQTRKVEAFEGALLAAPAGAQAGPTLILLGGSEGGSLITRDAAHWASFGYTVLALPYYSPPTWTAAGPGAPELPGLPANFFNIPVERLQAARDWLAQQPEADATRIGVMGTSKGAEFALLAGTKMPWIKAIAALVPSDVVWSGWGQAPDAPPSGSSFAWQGRPFDYVDYKEFAEEFAGLASGKTIEIRRPHDKGRAAATAEQIEKARIPVEQIAAPVLVAGGDDDRIWASGPMAAAIAKTRAAAGRKTVSLVFPEAGHFLGGTGTSPTTHYNAGPSKNGGTPAANARAQAAVHAALRSFFAESLK